MPGILKQCCYHQFLVFQLKIDIENIMVGLFLVQFVDKASAWVQQMMAMMIAVLS